MPRSADLQLNKLPNTWSLLLRAISKTHTTSTRPSLPTQRIEVTSIRPSVKQWTRYANVVQWPVDSAVLHPCFMHVLGFPLHLQLMASPSFPFKVLGLIHINNTLQQYRPVTVNDPLRIQACLGGLAIHNKGWLFSVLVDIFVGDERVFSGNSQYLSRAAHGLTAEVSASPEVIDSKPVHHLHWQLAANLGWRYAKASGDFNPIHLHPLSAKLLGFKRHIAHGMWSKAKLLSECYSLQPESFSQGFRVEVEFKLPVYLPNQLTIDITREQATQWLCVVHSPSGQPQSNMHLRANIDFTP